MAFLQYSSNHRIRSIPRCGFSASPTIRKRSLSSTARRAFWWWWTKHDTSNWAPSPDDSFQRHTLRKQKMLRYKYSRAIRRRQLWDRDPSQNLLSPTWDWQVSGLSGTHDGQALSSKSSPPTFGSSQKSAGREAYDDFTQLKACIDRDPFGAVFGRRLMRHRKPNDASWSSGTFNSTPPKDCQRTQQKPAVSKIPPTSKPSSIVSSNTGLTSRLSDNSSDNGSTQEVSASKPPGMAANSVAQADEYEFDPISMRKVLKSRPKPGTSAVPRKPLFDPLFTEKGVDIPVKPYKSQRVSSYSEKLSSNRPSSKWSPSKGAQSKAESSRLVELRNLKAATLGNSIDTTAQYHGEWIPEAQEAKQKSKVEPTKDSTAVDAPLFSGTTYEAKSKEILKGVHHLKQDWLNREGFGTKQEPSTKATWANSSSKAEIGRHQSTARLQPALDRLRSSGRASDRLEPSLNRSEASSKNTIPSGPRENPIAASHKAQDSTSEDLDLLRASDIRASSRSSRQSKQGSERSKQEQRHKLDQNFASHQRRDDGLSVVFPNAILASSKKLSESLNDLWHRVRAQRMTWLANKVRAFSKKGDSVVQNGVESIDCKKQEAPGSEVNAVSKACKVVASPVKTFTPSQEVLDAEKESISRMLALRRANLAKKELEARARETEKALAQRLKATYEDEYGPITINHRQVEGTERRDEPSKEVNEVKVQPVIRKPAAGAEQKESSLPTVPLSTNLLRYKILAYDSGSFSNEVTIAETTSSLSALADTDAEPSHPTEVLSRLNNVTKFMPYFADMEKQGYEIVSGSGDVLVFRQTRSPAEPADNATKPSNAITEGSTKPSAPSTRPPSPSESAVEALPSDANSPKVRRQEDVFSGSGQTWHQEEQGSDNSGGSSSSSNKGSEPHWFRKMVKRVFLTGASTAAIAYTIGVAAEQAGARVQKSPSRSSGRPGIYSTEDSR